MALSVNPYEKGRKQNPTLRETKNVQFGISSGQDVAKLWSIVLNLHIITCDTLGTKNNNNK